MSSALAAQIHITSLQVDSAGWQVRLHSCYTTRMSPSVSLDMTQCVYITVVALSCRVSSQNEGYKRANVGAERGGRPTLIRADTAFFDPSWVFVIWCYICFAKVTKTKDSVLRLHFDLSCVAVTELSYREPGLWRCWDTKKSILIELICHTPHLWWETYAHIRNYF